MAKKRPVMVFITAQIACERIIRKGAELAGRLKTGLIVVTAQPKKADARRRAADMRCLELLARDTQSEIQILYTDDPVKSLARFAKKQAPVHIFTGQQSPGSNFVGQLAMLCDTPITMVSHGTVCTLPPLSAMLTAEESHTVA